MTATTAQSHRASRRAFTLVELIVVMVILAVLAAVAIPQFFDHARAARLSAMEGVIGSVATGLATTRIAYETNLDAILPPDANDDDSPDHLGDLSGAEKILFDGVLQQGYAREPRGWKPYTIDGFPVSGRFYIYIYDTDGDDAFDAANEGYLIYDGQLGQLSSYIPPA